jgi:DNA-binding MarR family transcriptional regulator
MVPALCPRKIQDYASGLATGSTMTRRKETRFPAETAWRRTNMSRLLFSAAWLFDSRILTFVNANGFPQLRMVHLHVPRNLDLRGTRLTDLAMRAAMSKQSMAQIIDECEAMDLIRRVPDPSDRRAKLVAFTTKGLHLMKVVRAALSSAERDMAHQIGAKRLSELVTALGDYLEPDNETTDPGESRPARITRFR